MDRSAEKSGRDDHKKPPVTGNGHARPTQTPSPRAWVDYSESAGPDDSEVTYVIESQPIVHAEGFWKVPVFFGTDRKPSLSSQSKYGKDQGNKLLFGHCIVTLPDAHKPGDIPRPRNWLFFKQKENPLKHVTVKSVEQLSNAQFKERLQARVNKVSRKDVLLFVHGYKTTFNDAAYRTAQLAFDLEFYSPVVMFSWPSDGTLGTYVKDLATVDLSGSTFRRFLSVMRESTQGASIHVIAHSMGNRLATLVLDEIGRESAGKEKLVKSFILAAPDMGVEELRPRFQGIRDAAESVTLYTSANDQALRASTELQSGTLRIGMPGDHLVEFCTTDGVNPIKGVYVIDATDANSGSFLMLHHSYVGNNRCVLDDVRQLLAGIQPGDRGLIPRGFLLAMNRCVR